MHISHKSLHPWHQNNTSEQHPITINDGLHYTMFDSPTPSHLIPHVRARISQSPTRISSSSRHHIDITNCLITIFDFVFSFIVLFIKQENLIKDNKCNPIPMMIMSMSDRNHSDPIPRPYAIHSATIQSSQLPSVFCFFRSPPNPDILR